MNSKCYPWVLITEWRIWHCQKIPNTKTIVNTHDFDYELTFDTQKDMRPAVFDFAHDNGLKILSLQQKNEGLEKKFNALTKES